MRLARPCLRYAGSFREMAEEFQARGELCYSRSLPLIRADFPAYLKEIERMEGPRGLPPGRVPQTEFWLIDETRRVVLGTIRFRHALTPALENCGGQIGYAIRPTERGKGYGKRMLALLLDCLKEMGWRRVLVTCDAGNAASACIITANGGVLEDQRRDESSGRLINRYWINLRDSDAGL